MRYNREYAPVPGHFAASSVQPAIDIAAVCSHCNHEWQSPGVLSAEWSASLHDDCAE
jgi:hypothetical protein